MQSHKRIFIYSILLIMLLLFISGCNNNNNQELSDSKTELSYRTAQANSFTVNQPYTWSRQFTGLPEGTEDISAISQGLSENDIYMIIVAPSEEQTNPTTKILFAVNNLSISGLSFAEYIEYVTENMNFATIINSDIQDDSATLYYSYNSNGIKVYEIKKYLYKDELLLTAIATVKYELKDNYENIFADIINSIKIRE